MKKIYIAILDQGWIRRELAPVLAALKSDQRFYIEIRHHSLRPIAYNRNNIVKQFLKTDCDFLLMIDHDNVPCRNPLDLVLLDKDIIGCPYLQVKNNETGWMALKKLKDGYNQVKIKGDLQEVDAVGTGVILIARRVLEKVKIPFERKWKGGFPLLGLDFYFCEKAKKLGFKIWVHWKYLASHYKEVNLLEYGR